jgi:predicted permease
VYTLVTKGSLGDFVIHWMSTTWINTIIFGVPVMAAIFTPAETAPLTPVIFATRYAVLASISSFFFQLPVQLILLELHRRRQAILVKQAKENGTADVEAAANPFHKAIEAKETNWQVKKKKLKGKIEASSGAKRCCLAFRFKLSACWRWYGRAKTSSDSSASSITISILLRIFTNAPILGIIAGFIWAACQPRQPVLMEVSAKPIDEFVTNFANAVTPGMFSLLFSVAATLLGPATTHNFIFRCFSSGCGRDRHFPV